MLGHEQEHHDQTMAALRSIQGSLVNLTRKVNKIMSEDAAIEAEVADEQTQLANLTQVMADTKTLVDKLVSEVNSGTASVSAQTMADLQNAQSQLDAFVASAQSQLAAEQAEDPAAAPPADAPPAQ